MLKHKHKKDGLDFYCSTIEYSSSIVQIQSVAVLENDFLAYPDKIFLELIEQVSITYQTTPGVDVSIIEDQKLLDFLEKTPIEELLLSGDPFVRSLEKIIQCKH